MFTTIVQAIIVLALEAYVFAKFQMSLAPGLPTIPKVKVIPTYLSLFIFGFIYQILLVYDSLRLKNTIQVIGLCCYNVGLLIYAAVQYHQIQDAISALYLLSPSYIPRVDLVWPVIRPILIAVPCVIALGNTILAVAAWKLYDEFAWTIYKHISADLRMKRRYLVFQIYMCILKFDFFFFLGFTVQFLVIVTQITDVEFYLTIAAVPVTIGILLMAAFWTSHENVFGMIVTIVLFFGGLAYFIFKLVRMYQPSHAWQYIDVRTSLTIFAVFTIILIFLTITNACLCMANFGKGLKPFVTKRRGRGDDEKLDQMTEMPDLKNGPLPSRMTID